MQHIINDEEYNEFMRLRKESLELVRRINELKNFEDNYNMQKEIFRELNKCWDKQSIKSSQFKVTIDKQKLESFFKYYLLIQDVRSTFDWVE